MKYFQINAENVVGRSRRFLKDRVGNVTIKLPFVSFSVNPEAKEKEVSKKAVVWMADRRVLSSKECCDDCIDRSLISIGKIREKIIEYQVELSDLTDGALYLLLEFAAEGLRQFQTYTEQIEKEFKDSGWHSDIPDFKRDPNLRQKYFDALEILREHIGQCLGQVSNIAEITPPKVYGIVDFQNGWRKEIYTNYDLPTPKV